VTPEDKTPFDAGRETGEHFAALILRNSHSGKATRNFYNAATNGLPMDTEGRREWLNGFAIAAVTAAGATVETDTPDADSVVSQLDDISSYIAMGSDGDKALDLIAELRSQFKGDA
jgi:hypothetical protein